MHCAPSCVAVRLKHASQPASLAGVLRYGTIPLIGAILIAIWTNNKRIDDLKDNLTSQIDGLREFIRSEVKRLEERIERLEHPLLRG